MKMEHEDLEQEEESRAVQLGPIQPARQGVVAQDQQQPITSELDLQFQLQKLAVNTQRTLAIVNDPDSRVRTSNYLKIRSFEFMSPVNKIDSGIRGLKLRIKDNW